MCCRIVCFGWVFLVVSLLACGLSFVAPFWLLYPDTMLGTITSLGGTLPSQFSEGLFATCTGATSSLSCKWFWEDNFSWEKNLPGWFSVIILVYKIRQIIKIINNFKGINVLIYCRSQIGYCSVGICVGYRALLECDGADDYIVNIMILCKRTARVRVLSTTIMCPTMILTI